MGFGSQAGQVLFRTQSVKGTYPADMATAGVAMKLRGGSLGINRDLLIADPEIGGGRDTVDAYLGAASWGGDYEFYARLEALPTLLKGVLGTAGTVTTTGVSTHTITPSDSAILPWIGIEERIGSGLETYNYTDGVVNTFHLEADANGYLQGTAGMIAAKQEGGKTPTPAPIWDNSAMIVGTNIVLTLGGVSLPAKSFGFDINNNFEDDDFRLGSFFLGDLTAKAREVSGSFAIRPETSALWRRAAYGLAAATAVGGLPTKDQLIITATTYEDIVGGTPATKGSVTITVPNIILEPYNLEPSGDDVIESDISFRAVRPVAGTAICTVVVKCAKPAIA